MTLFEFKNLSVSQQFQVASRGTFLARRTEVQGYLNLYHLPGDFFAELYCDLKSGQALWLRVFQRPARLAGYAAQVQLPDDWT